MALKLLHAADLHLDSPFHRLTAQQAAQRRGELRQIPARLARLAREEEVDLVLLPGDLFDGERVYPETVRALAGALADIPAPVFIAPGNHDFYHPSSPYETTLWPENVHIFTSPAVTGVPLTGLNCVVYGCAFPAPRREDDPLLGFSAPRDGRLHLLCLHGDAHAPAGGVYAPIAPQSLAGSGVHYAALGHIHAPTGLRWAGPVPWAYPGCPEGRGFDECGERGALTVTVEPGQVQTQFHPLCRRQYQIRQVELAAFPQALAECPPEDLVRWILTGESAAPPDLAALAAQAQEHCFYAEVRDETTLPQDLWARREENSLTGLFLREMARRLEGADGEGRAELLLAARFGLAALEGGEDIRP